MICYMDRYPHFSSHKYRHYTGNQVYKENGGINEIILLCIKKSAVKCALHLSNDLIENSMFKLYYLS